MTGGDDQETKKRTVGYGYDIRDTEKRFKIQNANPTPDEVKNGQHLMTMWFMCSWNYSLYWQLHYLPSAADQAVVMGTMEG